MENSIWEVGPRIPPFRLFSPTHEHIVKRQKALDAEMLLMILGEILIGLLVYRSAKKNGTLPAPKPKEEREAYVQRPLPPNATRLEKIAHWLGLEEKEEDK